MDSKVNAFMQALRDPEKLNQSCIFSTFLLAYQGNYNMLLYPCLILCFVSIKTLPMLNTKPLHVLFHTKDLPMLTVVVLNSPRSLPSGRQFSF